MALTITGAPGGATITDDTSTNATRYLLFDDVTSGASTTIGTSSTKLTYNPSTGSLSATKFLGDGSQLTGVSSGDTLPVSVISTNTNAVRSTIYILTSALTLTLPAAPAIGDWVRVANRSGTTTCVLNRNGNNIMSLAENMTVDLPNAVLTLVYANATLGWTLI